MGKIYLKASNKFSIVNSKFKFLLKHNKKGISHLIEVAILCIFALFIVGIFAHANIKSPEQSNKNDVKYGTQWQTNDAE